ncbi:hypothetical protein ACRRTK_018153 [Alexandromys fortis]
MVGTPRGGNVLRISADFFSTRMAGSEVKTHLAPGGLAGEDGTAGALTPSAWAPDPAVQTVINSQNLWDDMLLNKGLTVIDVYQAWCGPCKAVQPLFRKLKNELNEDEILHFAVAEADNIVTLQSFRDKCEPVFLFSLNGKIIAKIQGANAPLINRKVITLIDEEKKIAAGEMARPQYVEITLVDQSEEELGESQYDSIGETYSMTILKPDAVLRRKHIEVKEKPDFEEFVAFVISGLSCVLLTSQGEEEEVIQEETQSQSEEEEEELSEHPDEPHVKFAPMVAMKKKRGSLQEYLERQHIAEFCDAENDPSKVSKFIDILFPDFKTMKSMNIQRTLALLRPEVYEDRKDDVLDIIQKEGFTILMQRQILLSEEEARRVCKNYENEEYFSKLLAYMSSSPSYVLVLLRANALEYWKELMGPKTVEEAFASDQERGTSIIMVLTKWNAVAEWRRMMGPVDPEEARLLSPDSLRANYGLDILRNAVHGASNASEAAVSINNIFTEDNPED